MQILPPISSAEEAKLRAAMVYVPERMREDVEQDVCVARLMGNKPALAAKRKTEGYRKHEQREVAVSQL